MLGGGGALFIVSYLGAQAGWTVLPFDRHHVIGQVGGFLIAVTGLTRVTK